MILEIRIVQSGLQEKQRRIAEACRQCQVAVESIRPLLRQNKFRKLPECVENNQEVNTERVIELLKEDIARHGIPQAIRTTRPGHDVYK